MVHHRSFPMIHFHQQNTYTAQYLLTATDTRFHHSILNATFSCNVASCLGH